MGNVKTKHKIMRFINANVAQSKNYITQKFIARNILDMKCLWCNILGINVWATS